VLLLSYSLVSRVIVQVGLRSRNEHQGDEKDRSVGIGKQYDANQENSRLDFDAKPSIDLADGPQQDSG
jgi:hypothetical protein